MSIYREIQQIGRRSKASLSGAKLGKNVQFGSQVVIRKGIHEGLAGKISVGENSQLLEGVILDAWGGSITIDQNTFIGPYSVLYGHGGITIGSDCLIAEHCSIHSANHTIPDKERRIRWEPDKRSQTTIGNDVWLGAGSRILAGVTIGDGCVVGASAVVDKDLEPYSVAVGIPAKVIRSR